MPMPVFDKDNNMLMLEVGNIFCIHKNVKTRKILVTAESGEFYVPSTIEQIGDIMHPMGFLQIDKNNVINVCRIKSLEGNEVSVDGSTYEVSRRQLITLKEMITKYRPLT
ncbi:LytTR family transcriptional regulator DNA-binding domain-containing protein [Paenibacillus harenae]|uniref:LytTR family transcriptional regulator DNA-binding domain-containing protein n=1 Tax=Paenibacillus harenae TaxID=306543 RepID=UPI00278C9D76|nr:LytTR family transcriptional regulator DNA-binding domain-containing protein [Paenibacillus harenae]MDQ0062327.1 DNA-binding LytR/AlgR family response regulator [Paenibacillus harenae]